MKKLIYTLLFSTLGVFLLFSLFFFRTYSWYQLIDDEGINNEIVSLNCHFGRSGETLFINIVECDWYGNTCINGQKIVDGTLHVTPYFNSQDTLRYIEKIEGSLLYECPNYNNDCWADKLKIRLSYKFDSVNIIYDRQLLKTLTKKWDVGFSVH